MRNPMADFTLTLWLLVECVEAKKYCWYFEGGYPIYFICRSYEDCCGTRCCVRALSIQRLWYFWVLLMMAVLFCCGAGFFIRRRMYPSHLRDEPAFNVSFTRHPVTTPVSTMAARHLWFDSPQTLRVAQPGHDRLVPVRPTTDTGMKLLSVISRLFWPDTQLPLLEWKLDGVRGEGAEVAGEDGCHRSQIKPLLQWGGNQQKRRVHSPKIAVRIYSICRIFLVSCCTMF
ncbi:uncharacterized protein vopp1b isoform X2 [Acanthochromis polyacanthus]|uniref:uncharacterized protein vopp1b isoform X2 n=1 Tax=Acanthochromis polyacanthus TaxID=80966 RepID=UPI0022345751|nr:uncharacterized protein vopp1b isoform X2 [Acanthochromis polyacanthus]